MRAAVADELDWTKGDGLLPAIVQHAHSGTVLMLGYMNREAFDKTVGDGYVTFFSRSRQTLWRKGETSGNLMETIDVAADCDRDTLLVRAVPNGPACHLGTATCFDRQESGHIMSGFLGALEQVIRSRLDAKPKGSYIADLAQSGRSRRAQKVGEEAVELALASVAGERAETVEEAADLLFHVLVLLAAEDIALTEVIAALEARHQKA
jgi:phosphoribosyl-ATP pyrophosphohydrolase/phosphoribosyl-AMP cyclohydrolase